MDGLIPPFVKVAVAVALSPLHKVEADTAIETAAEGAVTMVM